MKLSMLNTRRFIFSPTFGEAIKSEPIVLADAGARGELHEPWAGLNENVIYVIGFEPDENECNRLNSLQSRNRLYVPNALWSFEGRVNLHLASEPSTSSVHPPNFELIQKYNEKHWKPRVTKQVITVNCTTLDKVLEDRNLDLDCDFLKIDTHGAEYEILQGATASLRSNIFGVLVETWTSEVHRGQYLTGDILNMMAGMGFSLFDINVAATWRRQTAATLKLFGKQQIIGLDLLFFKEPATWLSRTNTDQKTKIIKAAAIAEVYGFPDYAVELLNAEIERSPDKADMLKSVRDTIIQNSRTPLGFRQKLKRKLYRIRIEDYPSLHY